MHKREDQRRPSLAARGYPSNWPAISADYRRRHPRCESVHGCARATEVAHHVTPIGEGGDSSDANLQALCKRCHDRLGGRGGRG